MSEESFHPAYDASVDIEVTPEMVRAGMDELRFYRPAEDSTDEAEEYIRAIFLAMFRLYIGCAVDSPAPTDNAT